MHLCNMAACDVSLTYQSSGLDLICIDEPLITSSNNHRLIGPPVIWVTVGEVRLVEYM